MEVSYASVNRIGKQTRGFYEFQTTPGPGDYKDSLITVHKIFMNIRNDNFHSMVLGSKLKLRK
jgi:hypothetical protein